MTDFAAIDFETANEQPSSVCSVGVVIVRDGEIVDSFYSLIHPEPEYYQWFCRQVHCYVSNVFCKYSQNSTGRTTFVMGASVGLYQSPFLFLSLFVSLVQSYLNEWLDDCPKHTAKHICFDWI